jgi:crotonobetainyl-CoA:carnitine CoA-transferase CaiB-like acyl-CoA transferase
MKSGPVSQRPLAGIRVLDFSRLLPGPYCSFLLAELGADVIKIESPLLGDWGRLAPAELGLGGMFGAVNRGKRSLAINVRRPAGRAALLRLAATVDVVLEAGRPGAMSERGLGYEDLRAVNPDIVYCSLSGYGASGPDAARAGHDVDYLAVSGLLALGVEPGSRPGPPGFQVADLAGGMLAAIAILGALLGRERSGQGAYLDIGLLDAAVSWLDALGAAASDSGAGALTGRLPCYGIYETADGRHLAVGALEPPFWVAFCGAIERLDLVERQYDPAAVADVAAVLGGRTAAGWLELFEGTDACLAPVNAPAEAIAHPQVRHRLLVRPALPPAPAHGADTAAILREAGLDDEAIAGLVAAGVVGVDADRPQITARFDARLARLAGKLAVRSSERLAGVRERHRRRP